jgi:hypothetical protein
MRFGQVLLSIERLQREMPHSGSPTPGERDTGGSARHGALKVSSCQAYDYLLLAGLKAQVRGERAAFGFGLLGAAREVA